MTVKFKIDLDETVLIGTMERIYLLTLTAIFLGLLCALQVSHSLGWLSAFNPFFLISHIKGISIGNHSSNKIH